MADSLGGLSSLYPFDSNTAQQGAGNSFQEFDPFQKPKEEEPIIKHEDLGFFDSPKKEATPPSALPAAFSPQKPAALTRSATAPGNVSMPLFALLDASGSPNVTPMKPANKPEYMSDSALPIQTPLESHLFSNNGDISPEATTTDTILPLTPDANATNEQFPRSTPPSKLSGSTSSATTLPLVDPILGSTKSDDIIPEPEDLTNLLDTIEPLPKDNGTKRVVSSNHSGSRKSSDAVKPVAKVKPVVKAKPAVKAVSRVEPKKDTLRKSSSGSSVSDVNRHPVIDDKSDALAQKISALLELHSASIKAHVVRVEKKNSALEKRVKQLEAQNKKLEAQLTAAQKKSAEDTTTLGRLKNAFFNTTNA